MPKLLRLLQMTVMTWILAASIDGTDAEYKRVCYYTNWSQYRPEGAKFFPEDVDPWLCTHIVYAFAGMDGNRLIALEWNDDSTSWSKGMYERVNSLKKTNPQLKTLLAVGGWNFGTAKMTAMLASAANRNEFATTSIQFLRERNFDGLDLDFEYPGSRGSPPGDKPLFTNLVQELRNAFNAESLETGREALLLTAAVAAGKENIDNAYEVPELSKHLDFISLMTYDLNGAWDPVTGHNAPLYRKSDEVAPAAERNVEWAANYWVSLGAPTTKLIIGMATYGRCFTLTNPANNGLGAPASGSCPAGQYTREPGFRAYYEICQALSDHSVKTYWSEEHKVPYLSLGAVWTGYDDQISLTAKVNWLKAGNFGGWMVWAIDLDDFKGSFCARGPYPLITTLKSVLLNGQPSNVSLAPLSTILASSTKKKKVPTATLR